MSVVRKPADTPAVAASLNMDLARIREWCNHWCMILNPNKTKALVVYRSRTVSPPWWLGPVYPSQSQLRHPWCEVWQQAHRRRPCACIVSSIAQRIGTLKLVKCTFVETSVLLCCNLHLFFQSLSIVLRCGGQLLNVTYSFLSASCIRWPSIILIWASGRCHRCRVAGIRKLDKVNSNSSHCLFSELISASTTVLCGHSSSIGVWSINV